MSERNKQEHNRLKHGIREDLADSKMRRHASNGSEPPGGED